MIIVDNGFIKTLDNNTGITFGADFFFGKGSVFLPVGMQWNFFLSTQWSVFGEPGVGFATKGKVGDIDAAHPLLSVGGRYHFNETVALTMRIGYPAASVGVSFLF